MNRKQTPYQVNYSDGGQERFAAIESDCLDNIVKPRGSRPECPENVAFGASTGTTLV
jgi:hypothetical protein